MVRLVLLLGPEDRRMFLGLIKKKIINHDVILDFFFPFRYHLVTIATQCFTTTYLYSTREEKNRQLLTELFGGTECD